MRALFFAVAVCLVGVAYSNPMFAELQPVVADPVAVEDVAALPAEDAIVGSDDATSVDEYGRPKRQFIAGLVTGALLAGGGRPYYGYGGYGYGYGRPYHHHHHHRPHYGGYGGYYGYGK